VRASQAETQLAALEQAAGAARAATFLAEIDDAAREAKKAAPRDVALQASTAEGGTKKKKAAGRTPYRTFLARSGRKLLVGKGAADNDALTLKVGRPHDLWIHAKDRTGAHVIVPIDKGQTCPAEDLVDGAHLAAHFSDAREEKVVDVQYTDRRYLRKPKGSPPGFVVVDREKVIVLRVQPEILSTLLEREDVG
jgi:predicted ribosome quality control (RQC) complex YloA/Tae2 family protein